MKNQWINFFSGNVKIIIQGKGVERFLNDCTRKGIHVWNVKKMGAEAYTCYVMLKDIKPLRSLMKHQDCRFRFLTRKGLPFLAMYSIKNSGIVVGLFLAFLAVFLLSNMVWDIEVKGAEPATEHKIMQELDKLGVKKGKFQFFLKDVESIQRYLTDTISEITWIGVVLNGTSYHFEVVEKNEPEKPEALSPRSLVASKKALISKIYVEKGQPLVQVNDYVKEGQVLVSGLIGREDNKKSIAAVGEVLGETWYLSQVDVPIKTTFTVLTGEVYQKHYLKLGSFKLPIWGFFEPEYAEKEEFEAERPFFFLKWKLPISYVGKTIHEQEVTERVYDEEEIVEKALEIGRQDLFANKLDEDAIIKGEKVLRTNKENGKVRIDIHFQVIESIVKIEPIIQGD
ncbi:Putative stage IV sporulation protein YqfD [Bacillus sp. THAF10]|uniref:sporulation protein YqfD n=1 Tax=Bacillus sp. THAF10 TaxID=2587848 RepID=UPI001267E92F|nr:sporulation protein YqfD [Bacillus sp. THAF10]QFT89898.1 Putative stage IV sporulation protein YqfD [Bacillus sp. THAF10]